MNVLDSWINGAANFKGFSAFPKIGIGDIFEIAVLAFLIYYCIKNLRHTRAWLLFKGIILGVCFYIAAYLLKLNVIVAVFQSIVIFLAVAIIVAIQPELRKFMETIGTDSTNNSIFYIFKKVASKAGTRYEVKKKVSDITIQELAKACYTMGKAKTGALIVLEGKVPLNEYLSSGIRIDAATSAPLLINTFEKNTPLHDGAVIICDDRVAAATCYLPLSENKKINKSLGTRHRAAIGLTEITDSLVIIVSEETGAVSIAINGTIKHKLEREKFVEELNKFQDSFEVQLNKPRNSFKDTLPQKITSGILAVALWIIVVLAINPTASTTIKDIEVRVINEDAITSLDKTYSIVSGGVVDITLTGNKSLIDSLDSTDIAITADLRKLSMTDAAPLEVYIIDDPDVEFKLSETSMVLEIEELATVELNVTTDIPGTESGIYVSKVKLSDNSLVITGAESIVKTIGSVIVSLQDVKLSDNGVIELKPQIYDRNGELLDNKRFTLSTNEITAEVELYNTKEIELKVNATIADENLRNIVKDIEVKTKSVVIAGDDEVLSKLNELVIDTGINFNIQDISKKQYIKYIDLHEYLPAGVVVVSNEYNIPININFIEFVYAEVPIDVTDISIVSASEQVVEVKEATTPIKVISTDTNITSISPEDLGIYIDVQENTIGEHTVSIKFNTKNLYVVGEYSADVAISSRRK